MGVISVNSDKKDVVICFDKLYRDAVAAEAAKVAAPAKRKKSKKTSKTSSKNSGKHASSECCAPVKDLPESSAGKRSKATPPATKKVPAKENDPGEEIKKPEAAGLVRGVLHQTWLADPVVVRKANGKWGLCIDYTDLNKACPKDPFPLSCIDQIVESTIGCELLSFLDAYSGYHQIFMAKEDEEKTTFITPCGMYYFIHMSFGLKSAGSTINMKLNPEKCVFGVPSGKRLGFFVS
nr:uncharacterized protein LOC120968758 [Aegilops tauschii subsp. strangulata]